VDAVAVRFDDGRMEPLCSIYCSSCLPAIEASLVSREFKISDIFSRIAVAYVTEEELRQCGLSGEIFTNVNTPEEFRQLVELGQKAF
jgi:molybdopterin-guanine dinucleotide biosynthesis protein A